MAAYLLGVASASLSNSTIEITGDHGVTASDQRKLLQPIGTDPQLIDRSVSVALNAYRTKRGAIGHKVKIRTREICSSVFV